MSEENNLQPQEEQFETDWSKLSFLTTKEKRSKDLSRNMSSQERSSASRFSR